MISFQELGDYTIADEDFFDVQAITDGMMSISQSIVELMIRFFLNLLVCWILVQFFYYKNNIKCGIEE